MDNLDFDRQTKVLDSLVGDQGATKLFNEIFQGTIEDLLPEIGAGQRKEIILERVSRLKNLLEAQILLTKMQLQELLTGEAIVAGGMN